MIAGSGLAQAYYDLATLLDAGVPILRSLDILIQGRQGFFRRVLSQIRESLSKGSSLAESMTEHPSVFPDLDRMLIQAAETSGSLGESFKMLSYWHEFVHRITRRMMINLLYPFLLLHIAACIFGLPGLVLGTVTVAAYLKGILNILLFLYIPMIVVVVFVLLRDRIPVLRLPLDSVALKVPVLGQGIYHLSVCRYAKVFAMLYKAGVPISETTERATRATGNVIVAGQFAGGRESVRRGGMVSEGFSNRLPAEYRHLWQIGEETGEMDKMATKVAEISGDRADLFCTEFANWLPKVVYFIILIVMGLMALSLGRQVYGNLYRF